MAAAGELIAVFRGVDLPGGRVSEPLHIRLGKIGDANDLQALVKSFDSYYKSKGLGGLDVSFTSSLKNIPDGKIIDYEKFIKAYQASNAVDSKSAAGFLDELMNSVDAFRKNPINPTTQKSIYTKSDGTAYTEAELKGTPTSGAGANRAAVAENFNEGFMQTVKNNKLATALALGGAGMASYAGIMYGGTDGKTLNIKKIDIVDVPKPGALLSLDKLNAIITYETTLTAIQEVSFKLRIGDILKFQNEPSLGVLAGKNFEINTIITKDTCKITLNDTNSGLSDLDAQSIAKNEIDNYCGALSPCPSIVGTCKVDSKFVNHLAATVGEALESAALFAFLAAKNILPENIPTNPAEFAAWLAGLIADALEAAAKAAAAAAAGAAGAGGRFGKLLLCNTIPIFCNKVIWLVVLGLMIALIIFTSFK